MQYFVKLITNFLHFTLLATFLRNFVRVILKTSGVLCHLLDATKILRGIDMAKVGKKLETFSLKCVWGEEVQLFC